MVVYTYEMSPKKCFHSQFIAVLKIHLFVLPLLDIFILLVSVGCVFPFTDVG